MANIRKINGVDCYYSPSEDHEDDCTKIWHDFRRVDNNKVFMTLDWSPYQTPSQDDVSKWIELGCPNRKTLQGAGGVGPMNSKEIQTAWILRKGTTLTGIEQLSRVGCEEYFIK